MKKFLLIAIVSILALTPVYAQQTVQQGGTGLNSVASGTILMGSSNPVRLQAVSTTTLYGLLGFPGNFATGTNFWSGSLGGDVFNLNTGNVGIGTSTPLTGTKLDVWGNLNVATSATSTLYANSNLGNLAIYSTTSAPTGTRLAINANTPDTGISITGITSGVGLLLGYTMSGFGINMSNITSGGVGLNQTFVGATGVGYRCNLSLANQTTGACLQVTGTANMTSDFTGSYVQFNPVRNVSAAATRIFSGNIFNITPSYTLSGAVSSILNVTGTSTMLSRTLSNASTGATSSLAVSAPVVAISNLKGAGNGTTTDSSSVLDVLQGFASSTGSVFTLTNNGLGNLGSFMGNGFFGIGTSSPNARLDIVGSVGMPFRVSSSSKASFFEIEPDGKIGIGSSTPSQLLTVQGNAIFTATTTSPCFSNNGVTCITTSGGAGGSVSTSTSEVAGYFSRWTTTGGPTALLAGTSSIFQSGTNNIGIGTTTPGSLLTVGGDILATGTVTGLSNGNSLGSGGSGTAVTINGGSLRIFRNAVSDFSIAINSGFTSLYANTNQQLTLGASNLEAMRFTLANFVGIGTSTPTSLLSVASSTATGLTSLFSVSTTTSIFNVLANGNVGIGTTTPSQSLAVVGNIAISGTGTSTFDGNVVIGTSGAGNVTPIYPLAITGSAVGAQKTLLYLLNNSSTGGATADIDFAPSATGAVRARIGAIRTVGGGNTDLAFWTSTTGTIAEKMRLTDAGNLGIGTTSPSALLHVNGSMRLVGSFADSINATGTSGQVLTSTGTSTLWSTVAAGGGTSTPSIGSAGYLQFASTTSGYFDGTSSLYFDKTNGRLAIGTTSPTATVHIASTANASLNITGGLSSNAATFTFADSNDVNNTSIWRLIGSTGANTNFKNVTNSFALQSNSSGGTILATNSTVPAPIIFSIGTAFTDELMRLASNKMVGIGTSTPRSLLSLASTTASGSSPLFTISSTTPVFNVDASGIITAPNLGTSIVKSVAGVLSQAVANVDYITGSYASSTFASTTFVTSNFPTFGYASSSFVTYPYASSTFVNYSYASSTFGGLFLANTWSLLNSFTSGISTLFTRFTGTSTPAYVQGQLVYDTGNESLTFMNNDSNISLQVGQEEWTRVINQTGSTITNGSAVYFNGASSTYPTIALARADAGATTIVAGLATEDIPNNTIGFITTLGVVHGINTAAYAPGTTVFLSATTSGAFASASPVSSFATTTYRYRIGIVAVSSATVGSVNVTPTTAFPANGPAGSLLTVSSTTGALTWAATTSPLFGFSSGGGGTPGGSNTHVQFNNSGVFGGVADFVWDNINKRLGIGTSSPISQFTVSNAANTSFLSFDATTTFSGNMFNVATSSTGVTLFGITQYGHISTGGAPATVSACGNTPAITGTVRKGKVTTGTSSPTTCLVTFSQPYTTAPVCLITPGAASPAPFIAAADISTSTFKVTFNGGATSIFFQYLCEQP